MATPAPVSPWSPRSSSKFHASSNPGRSASPGRVNKRQLVLLASPSTPFSVARSDELEETMASKANGLNYQSDSESEHHKQPVSAKSNDLTSLSPTSSEDLLSSTENTPTSFAPPHSYANSPVSPLLQWTTEDCADYVSSLGLGQYSDALLGMT